MHVTVVIPTYRRGAALEPTLASALGQEGVEVDVIVVEDAAGDETRAELDRFAGERVRIMDMPANGGAGAARQMGTAAAGSRFVAYLDDDDQWTPTHLRSCLDAIEAAGARWGYGGVTWVDGQLRRDHDQDLVPGDRVLARLFEGQALVTPSAFVVEKALLDEVGGWDPAFRIMGDWDLALRLALAAPAAASPEHSVLYVRHDDAMSRNGLEQALAELPLIVDRHGDAARRHGSRIHTGQFWRWLAYNAKDAGDRRLAARLFTRAGLADRKPSDLARAARLLLPAR